MSDPSVHQLRCLVALADTLHFGLAADDCGVSQPALSAQISKLEEVLGAQLVERTTRRVMLTDAGEGVLAHAREVIEQMDRLVESTRRASQPLTGPLRLGVIPTIAPYLLPPVLSKVRAKHPRLQLLLHEDQTARLVESLQHGRIDIALLALPVRAPGTTSMVVGPEPFELAVPATHRLSDRKSVSHADLADEEVLLLEDGHCLRDQALEVCSLAGANETSAVRANSISTLIQMVANGLGVTLLPETAVRAESRGMKDVRFIPFRGLAPSRTIGLLARKTFARTADLELLREMFRRQLEAS